MADLKFMLLILLALVIGGCANQPSLSAGTPLAVLTERTSVGEQAESGIPAAQLLSIAPDAAPFLASESVVISNNADGTIDLRNNTAAVRHASSDQSLGQPLLFAAGELPPTFTQCPLMEPLSTQLSRLTRTTRFLQPY
jgi:hypothetical protein